MSVRALRALTIAALTVAAATARAEKLPVHRYTTADGLANARVQRGTRDARGFLWFATQDGLSRFDGDRFDDFGTADGLPSSTVYDVAQTADGVLWVATEGGLARLDLAARAARPRFAALDFGDAGHRTLELFEDHAGQLWIGSEGGLWRRDGDTIVPVPLAAGGQPYVYRIVEDRDHTLWLGTSSGLLRRLPDGTIDHSRLAPVAHGDERVQSLLVDRGGRLWVGGLFPALTVVSPPPPGTPLLAAGDSLVEAGRRGGARHDAGGRLRLPARAGEVVTYDADDGFPAMHIRRGILEDGDGTIWIGGGQLVRIEDGRIDAIGAGQGLPAESMAPLVVDDAGNLWLGGASTGLVRLARRGLVAYDDSDGLDAAGAAFTEDAAGNLYAITCCSDGDVVNRFDGDHFVAVHPKRPTGRTIRGAWGINQIAMPARDGRWWVSTQDGAARYPAVARIEELASVEPMMFAIGEGLPGRDVLRLFGDARGDVWFGTMSGNGLARWDHLRDRVDAIALVPGDVPSAFAEDRRGDLWIGYDGGAVVRLTGGRPDLARSFGVADGLPGRPVGALLFDHRDRLWIATAGGVVRIDDPAAPAPAMRRYTTADGLATDQTNALAEDLRGRIHVGTVRGIDRIDPDTGELGHLSTADGLLDDYVNTAYRDREGRLWFGTSGGVARLLPDDAPRTAAPPVYLTSVRAGGAQRPIALDGERRAPSISLAHGDGQLDVGFTSPSFAVGQQVLFQVRLVGADHEWGPPQRLREVRYAHLAPGGYRFEVRALYEGGVPSAPATLELVVRPPIWRTWWFLGSSALALGLAGWWLYRRRVAHLLAVERVRTRIATDLHDDLGASLSRIAILSEVAARRYDDDRERGDLGDVVGDIGTSARTLVDVAADIVWSTDPRRDDLGSILVRLRSFAGDVLEARDIAWRLDAPADPARIKIGPDQRRHLYLILKEAITNAARHSGASRVTIRVTMHGRGIEAVVEDDGRGVTPARPSAGGNGLGNMRARARAAGGTLTIETPSTGGTRITLCLP